MRRNATILFGVIGLALTVGAGSVGAAAINCATGAVSNGCWGTEESDKLVGTATGELLVGLGGDDELLGGEGADNLHGDGSSVTFAATTRAPAVPATTNCGATAAATGLEHVAKPSPIRLARGRRHADHPSGHGRCRPSAATRGASERFCNTLLFPPI